MSEAEKFRAFARECMASAAITEDIDQREAFLEMALRWAGAAARLNLRNGLKVQAAGGTLSRYPVRGNGGDSSV
jgi:hypothetical protein